jgi:hypothetical protein
VIEKFRQKYGAGDVKKYYSKFDVAFRQRNWWASRMWLWPEGIALDQQGNIYVGLYLTGHSGR